MGVHRDCFYDFCLHQDVPEGQKYPKTKGFEDFECLDVIFDITAPNLMHI